MTVLNIWGICDSTAEAAATEVSSFIISDNMRLHGLQKTRTAPQLFVELSGFWPKATDSARRGACFLQRTGASPFLQLITPITRPTLSRVGGEQWTMFLDSVELFDNLHRSRTWLLRGPARGKSLRDKAHAISTVTSAEQCAKLSEKGMRFSYIDSRRWF